MSITYLQELRSLFLNQVNFKKLDQIPSLECESLHLKISEQNLTFTKEFSYLALVKRKIASALLLTQWFLGLSLLVFFPSQSHASQETTDQATLEVADQVVLDHGILPQSPDLETDLKLSWYIPTEAKTPLLLNSNENYCQHPLYRDSVPLFDIKTTFIHFFHTW